MIHDSTLIVGSSALAAIGVVDASAPSQLDILVGCDHSKALHTALCNSGFYSTPDTIKSHYTRTIRLVWSYHKRGYKSVNVIETINSTVWMHILASPSTAHTAFVSFAEHRLSTLAARPCHLDSSLGAWLGGV
ncbi:hypothetical protein BT96DRAFT_1010103 [Gymnopus androsaceus JB14]|uniref:Uncharacterized protein n=1 Tax=Gymnopus androsaceus JB14 TaxID=1447944 RepID=A0A6A4GB60_9AGAR|nr:hypothetical protein BT96DRAFT_1010103 [Gymnopus androsaceus JB14]